jgi:hypothetical protein
VFGSGQATLLRVVDEGRHSQSCIVRRFFGSLFGGCTLRSVIFGRQNIGRVDFFGTTFGHCEIMRLFGGLGNNCKPTFACQLMP